MSSLPAFGLLLWSILLSSTSTSALANRPSWHHRRNQASAYLDYRSHFSSQTGRELYRRANDRGASKVHWILWPQTTVKDPLSKMLRCIPLQDWPEQDCQSYNQNLIYASPLYLSWLFAHGLSRFLSRHKVRQILQNQQLSKKQIDNFLSKLKLFSEVDQLAWVYAMKHWQELVKDWPYLSRNIRGLGQPQDHDYAQDDSPQRQQFSEVARQNLASLNQFMRSWRSSPTHFLSMVKGRHAYLVKEPLSLKDYLGRPQYRVAAQALLDELKELLGSFFSPPALEASLWGAKPVFSTMNSP